MRTGNQFNHIPRDKVSVLFSLPDTSPWLPVTTHICCIRINPEWGYLVVLDPSELLEPTPTTLIRTLFLAIMCLFSLILTNLNLGAFTRTVPWSKGVCSTEDGRSS